MLGQSLSRALLAATLFAGPFAARADTPRDVLSQTALTERDRAAALREIAAATAQAEATLARTPDDAEARMTRAMATSYRAKLDHSRAEALSARAQFEALARARPSDPEAQASLGAWHLNAVAALGGFVARGGLGARKSEGFALTDRAIALGGDRALFTGIAALLRLAIDPRDPRGLALADAAAKGSTPTALDRALQRRAAQVAAVAHGGDPRLTQALARRLLPLGQLGE